jgi:hypothetical protein
VAVSTVPLGGTHLCRNRLSVMSKRTIQIAAGVLLLFIGVTVAALWRRQSPAQKRCVDNVYFPAEELGLRQEKAARIQVFYSAMMEAPFSCLDERIEAYRFLILPPFDPPASIRISRDGTQKVMVVRQLTSEGVPQNSPKDLKVNVTRPLTDVEWNHFQELFGRTSFWSMQAADSRETGLDGATFLIEGHRPNEYHAVVRWSPEDQNFLNACDYFFELARLEWKH